MVVQRLARAAKNPAQFVLGAFMLVILTGTLALRTPLAIEQGVEHPGWLASFFWATSATTVTGLSTTDIGDFSLFGELVILGLIQLGGFGVMTVGSVLAILSSHRVGLRQRMLARTEIGAVEHGQMKKLIMSIAKITILVEFMIAVVLFMDFALRDDTTMGRAAYSGIFHAVSAFNNAGISLYPDSLARYATVSLVVFPVTFAFIVGGLGFPILVELRHFPRPSKWSLHTRITLIGTTFLLIAGPVSVLALEWTNDKTLGQYGVWGKIQLAWFQGVAPRTAGFSTLDIGDLRESTLNVLTGFMFVGAGPASTSGGIKVTTFAILGFAMWAEVRGDRDINVFNRRLPEAAVRQAMTVALLGVGVVFSTAVGLVLLSPFGFTQTLFEAASAFGTVGLSTGITGQLPSAGQVLLMVVMLVGRVGPITFIAALALRERSRLYSFPEERPIIT